MPILTWQVVNATGVEVAVDSPSPPDGYGTYSTSSGSAQMPEIGCSAARGTMITHHYYVTTLGGAGGAQVSMTITVTVTVD